MKAIEIKDLSFKYLNEEEKTLENINFSIDKGEFILISGPSGGGKTTLFNIINGIIPNQIKGEVSGQIYIDQINMTGKSIVERVENIGSVLQNPEEQIIFEDMEDELAFPLENMNIKPEMIRKRVREVSSILNLDKNTDTRLFSGGEKQNLVIGTSLSMGQKILIFDEPLSNLDKKNALMLLDKLKDLSDNEGYTIIFIEHRNDIIIDYVDRIIWVENKGIEIFTDKKLYIKKINQIYEENISNIKKIKSTSDKDILMSLENVSYSVKDKNILKNINFDIYSGDKIVIVGDNGSGKTSLLNILSGLIKPTSGSVKYGFDQKELYSKLGVVLQNPSYQLFMSDVKSEIELESSDRKLVEDLTAHFSLEDILDKHPQSLSEGQKRKVGVASILAKIPSIIFFDEPTVGQDDESLILMIEAVSKLNDINNFTMLTITHDERAARFFGDKFVYMENGEIKDIGGIEIFDKYRKNTKNFDQNSIFKDYYRSKQ